MSLIAFDIEPEDSIFTFLQIKNIRSIKDLI